MLVPRLANQPQYTSGLGHGALVSRDRLGGVRYQMRAIPYEAATCARGGATAMENDRLIRISKFLSKHLRHEPDRLGLTLAPGGWVPVDDLLEACARARF